MGARMEDTSDRVVWEASLSCDLREETRASQEELEEEPSSQGKP